MDHDYLWDIPLFNHSPMRPARKGLVGENVFASEWAKLMAPPNFDSPANQPLADVMGSYGYRLKERAATVAASVICWLGTNCGRCFLEKAARLGSVQTSREDGYLMAWAVENARQSFSGQGRRTLEACLISDEKPTIVPNLSAQDYECAEHLVMWLGSDDGQKFLQRCETEISRQNQAESFKHHLSSNLRLEPGAVETVLKMASQYRPTPSGAAPAA